MQRNCLCALVLISLCFAANAVKPDDMLVGETPEKRFLEAETLLNNAETDEANARQALEQIQAQRPIETPNNQSAIGPQREMYDLVEGARRQAVKEAQHNLEETQKLYQKAKQEYEQSHSK